MKKIGQAILLLGIAYVVSSSACNDREDKLMKKGNEVVAKIENYKIQKGVLPASLLDIGIEEKEEGPLYYQKKTA